MRSFLEGDAFVGIAHGNFQHRFQRARDLQTARDAAHQHQPGLVEAGWRGLDRERLHLVQRHGVRLVAAEAEPGLDPALAGIDQRDGDAALRIACEDREVLGRLGERHAAGPARQAAIGIDGDPVLRARGHHRHLAIGRSDPGLRQQPARQHGFGQRYRDGKTSGRAQHAETFGERGARAAAIFRYPGYRQAGLGQRLPERRFPRAFIIAIDGLGVGEIGEDFLRGLGNDVVTLRHSVPRH